jgi:2-dehydropantoate 2-reductase
MRIAVMGTGGLGGFYGGNLAKEGNDISFIARGDHLKVLQRSGLRLVGPEGSTHIKNIVATHLPEDIGLVDIILFCVKLYDVEEAAKLIKPIVSKHTVIISVLNGINGPERLSKVLKKSIIFGGAARVSAKLSEPGIVTFLGKRENHKLIFGHPDNINLAIVQEFCNTCNKSGFPAEITDNINIELWDKLVQLTHVAGLTTLARCSIGSVLKDSALFKIGKDILLEVESVARAKGIALDPDIIQKKIKLIRSFPEGLYASMYHDLVSRKKIEVEDIFGYLSRQGREVSVKTPTIDFVYAFLKPYKNGDKK